MTDLNITTFRQLFIEYSDSTTYPDNLLTAKYAQGKCYVNDSDCLLDSDECRQQLFMLLLAHLLYLRDRIAAGNGTQGIINSASESKVSVSFQERPTESTFSYWLNQSPYGMEVLMMLEADMEGGMYFGEMDRVRISGNY